MSKAKYFPLAAAVAAMVFFLSCSDELKPIERETWEEYQRTLSSSGGAASPSSSSEGTNLSSSSEAGCSDYDAVEEFCYNNGVYKKCGDENGSGKHEYNPDTHFCHNNYTIAKCGGKLTYEPPDERCSYGVVQKQCGANWYNPSENYCHDNILYTCNGKPYNPLTQFCHNLATVYDKCGGSEYNPDTHYCHTDGKTYSCGNLPYDPSTHFCHSDNKTYSCGNLPYDPSTHFCLGSEITPLCGGEIFTGSQFCSGSTVHNKCGGTVTFTPGTEDCCGSNKYTLATHFCYGSKIGEYCGNRRTVEYDPDLYQCKPQINPNGIYLKAKPQDADGREYEAVLIGTQTWMAENLSYKDPRNNGQCANNSGNDDCDIYGRLYGSPWCQGTSFQEGCRYNVGPPFPNCPQGWHIPSGDGNYDISWNISGDWGRLLYYVQNDNDDGSYAGAGKYLKAKEGWNSCGPSGSGKAYLCEDAYGFSALPDGIGNEGRWWSNSRWIDSSYGALAYYHLAMNYNLDDAAWKGPPHLNSSTLSYVRCVKN